MLFRSGTYRPDNSVTRGQMATFLARALELEPVAGPSQFSDVDGTVHGPNINALAAAGIAGGFSDGTYRPDAPVSRGQMATFLTRAVGLPEAGPAPFSDIGGHTHEDSINRVFAAEIAGGFPNGTYRPDNDVTRGQMATFLARAFELQAV